MTFRLLDVAEPYIHKSLILQKPYKMHLLFCKKVMK